MSRIGKLPITLPKGVTLVVSPANEVTVKGPKGELKQRINPDIKVKIEDGVVTVERPTEQKRHKALHGLYRSLLSNMVKGVTDGYEKKLELVGVGFRATATGQLLELSVGYSHPVMFSLPREVKVHAEQLKGQNPIITLTSYDKQLIGQIASKIRSIRKPEPYKGKGIRYKGEKIKKKSTKGAAA